jgi:hypothetical protein
MMSEQLQRRIAAEESREAREAAQQERERREAAEQYQTRALQGAIADAVQRGEDIHPRALRGEGLGHTPAEFIALASAHMDLEDFQAEAAERRAYQRWQLQRSAAHSGDMSAPSQLQLEEGHQMQARAAKFREKVRDSIEVRRIAGQETARRLKNAGVY